MSLLDPEVARPVERKAERAQRQTLEANENRIQTSVLRHTARSLQEAQFVSAYADKQHWRARYRA